MRENEQIGNFSNMNSSSPFTSRKEKDVFNLRRKKTIIRLITAGK